MRREIRPDARRSGAGGWGITSNLSHPGVAPTNLMAARNLTAAAELAVDPAVLAG